MVALTGHREAYYAHYQGTPQEFVSAAKYGYLFQGQRYRWHKERRGTPALDISPTALVTFIQNHDQVANSVRGERCDRLSGPGRLRALTALLLLGPQTPMLFQGQEFAASSPFLFFADHHRELADLVHAGRRKFLSQFPSIALPAMQATIADPADPGTFARCKLDFLEREEHSVVYELHRDLIHLRQRDAVFRAQRSRGVDGAVLGSAAFVLRFFGESAGDRLLLINLGRDLHLDPAPEPLLAPSEDGGWHMLWSSEDPRYGGHATPALETAENWRLPGEAAVVLTSKQSTP
jgi:maltooligosyltrehalose trehalohydrolase